VPTPKYVQVVKPQPASQVSEPVMCGVMGELALGGSEARLLMCRSELALESKSTSIVVCELVLAEVVSVPKLFRTDSVRVDAAPRVVALQRDGCVLATTGQREIKKM